MQEESERRRRSSSNCGREDGGKRMLSLLFSYFSLSKGNKKSTKDQVLKPMYEIVSDVASELVETTVESIDDVSIDKTLKEDKYVSQSQPQRKGIRRSRFFRGILNLFQKNRISTMSSIGLAARLNETACDDSEMDGRPERPRKRLWKKSSSRHDPVHRNTRLPVVSFARRTKSYDSTSSVSGMESHYSGVRFDMDNSYLDSDDTSFLEPANLGVTFAHPVYTSKCRLLAADDKRPDTANLLWTKMNANVTDLDEDSVLPAKAYAETSVREYSQFSPAKAHVESSIPEDCWSVGSLSLYPSDEEKDRNDGNLYYGSFDSNDIPFDEIFTDASFFDIGEI